VPPKRRMPASYLGIEIQHLGIHRVKEWHGRHNVQFGARREDAAPLLAGRSRHVPEHPINGGAGIDGRVRVCCAEREGAAAPSLPHEEGRPFGRECLDGGGRRVIPQVDDMADLAST